MNERDIRQWEIIKVRCKDAYDADSTYDHFVQYLGWQFISQIRDRWGTITLTLKKQDGQTIKKPRYRVWKDVRSHATRFKSGDFPRVDKRAANAA